MPKPVFELSVQTNKSFKAQLDLIKQWPERFKKVQPMIAYMGADFLKRYVSSRLPKSSAYKGYRAGLEVVRVRGTRPGEYAYSVQIDPKNRFVKNIKVQRVLLYVEPSRRLASPSLRTLILEKYNPWTYETLPFTPEPKEGRIITRRASAQDVQKATVLRTRQRPKWRSELQKVGVREKKDKRLKLPKNVHNLPDVTLDALKLEFGLGKQRPKPAWRLGFSLLARQGFRAFIKDKRVLAFPLTKPSFNLWKQWPKKTGHTIPMSQARKYKSFQRKVAHRS